MAIEAVNNSIGRNVVQSSAWLYGRHLVTNVFNIFVIALLARKLSPGDFGVVALASVILRLLMSLGPIGVGSYIIYDRAEGREERVHAAFWLNIALTLAAVGVSAALVPVVALFYNTPGLQTIMYLLIAQFALGQLGGVPDALLQRALDFKKLALRETALEIINGAGMIVMALLGYGVWSLIIPSLILTPVRVLLAFKLAGWFPKLPLRRISWPGIFRYSFHTTGAGLVTYLANEGDTLLVGKTLGTTQLGFYNQAWTAANLVNRNVTGVVGKVAMPALSSVAEDPERLRNALNRMMRLLALASFPLLIGLLVVADLFVLTLYGPKWEASILPLQILIIYALRQSVGSSAAVIYNVVGRPDIGFKMGLTFLPFYGLSIWLGSFYGIVGVAVGVTAARTLYGVIQFAVVARLVGQTLTQLLANFGQPLLAAITLGFLVCGYRWLLYMAGVSGAILLGVLVLLGGITWIVLLVRLFPRMCEELVQMCESFSGEFGARVRRVMSPMMA